MENTRIKTYEDIVVQNINCGKYKTKKDAMNLIKYITGKSCITEKQKEVRYKGGCGVPDYDHELCHNAMYIIKKLYKKTGKNLRCSYHFVISLPAYIQDVNIIKLVSIETCQLFYNKGFQCIYGIHEDTDNLHIHIVVNSTNFQTGKQLHMSIKELKNFTTELKKTAFEILKENGF